MGVKIMQLRSTASVSDILSYILFKQQPFDCITSIIAKIPSTSKDIRLSTVLFPSQSFAKYYYFAYGSNLSQPFRSVLENQHHGNTTLERKFAFNKSDGTGKNIIPNDSSAVEGVIYQLTQEQMDQLDRCEGAPKHYKRTAVSLLSPSGKTVEAITYVAQTRYLSPTPLRPSMEYLHHILSGATQHHLHATTIQKIRNAALHQGPV
jgi:cation transport regulator ChaC